MPYAENDIHVPEGKVAVVTYENPLMLSRDLSDIQHEILGDDTADSLIICNDSLKRLSLKNSLMITAPFLINYQNKVFTSLLYKKLQASLQYEENYEERLRSGFQKIVDTIAGLVSTLETDITYSGELDYLKLYKMLDIKLRGEIIDEPLEAYQQLIAIVAELDLLLPVFYLNACQFLDETNWNALLELLVYNNQNAVLFESGPIRYMSKHALTINIDGEYDLLLK